MKKKTIILAVVICISLVPLSVQASTQDNAWKYSFSPYMWFAGMNGDVTIGENTSSVDVSFSDVWDDLNFATMFRFEAWKAKWGYYLEAFYLDAKSRVNADGTLLLKVDIDMWVIDLGAGYRIYEFVTDKDLTGVFDLLAGIRYYDFGTDIFAVEVGDLSSGTDWIDFVIGGRLAYPLSEQWTFRLRGDLAFGGSDLTWNAVAAFDYKWKENWSLLIGYRILDIDYEDGSGTNRKAFDVQMDGPALALTYSW